MKRKVFFLTLVAAIVLTNSVVGATGYPYHCDFSEWNELKEGETLVYTESQGLPVGWTFYMPQSPKRADEVPGLWIEPTTDARVGKWAVRVVDNSWTHSVGMISPEVPAEHYGRYTVSAWIKVIKCDPKDSIRAAAFFKTDEGLKRDNGLVLDISPGSDYEKIMFITKPAPAGTTGLYMYIWSEHEYTSEFLLDDVTIDEL